MTFRPIDRDALREGVRSARPFPHFAIDDFLEPEFAEEVWEAFPSYQQALGMGRGFGTVNEVGKVQVTDAETFPAPIRELHERFASREWLETLAHGFEIPELLADPDMSGGGIHITQPGGRLDVHLDFNYMKARKWFRRVNAIVFFNKDWKEEYGGATELWDRDIRVCHHSLLPKFNRCIAFATSDYSWHGVTTVRCPQGQERRSFAAFFYTTVPAPDWEGRTWDSYFKARPDEWFRGKVRMPLERLGKSVRRKLQKARRGALNR